MKQPTKSSLPGEGPLRDAALRMTSQPGLISMSLLLLVLTERGIRASFDQPHATAQQAGSSTSNDCDPLPEFTRCSHSWRSGHCRGLNVRLYNGSISRHHLHRSCFFIPGESCLADTPGLSVSQLYIDDSRNIAGNSGVYQLFFGKPREKLRNSSALSGCFEHMQPSMEWKASYRDSPAHDA